MAQEHGDGPILDHANELIDSLVHATPEDEQDDGGWGDIDVDSDDDGGDVEMSQLRSRHCCVTGIRVLGELWRTPYHEIGGRFVPSRLKRELVLCPF